MNALSRPRGQLLQRINNRKTFSCTVNSGFATFHFAAWMLLLCLVFSPCAEAQTGGSPEATPTKEAIRKGLEAANNQNWAAALNFFEDAYKASPENPEVLFNLALTESKIPGRELRAIAWFGAFLATSPDTPNASAIRDEIAQLQVTVDRNIQRLLKLEEDGTFKMPDSDDHGPHTAGYSRDYAFFELANGYAYSGDLENARRVTKLIQVEILQDSAKAAIITGQLRQGDFSGAKATWSTMKDSDSVEAKSASRDIRAAEQESGQSGASISDTPVSLHDWAQLFTHEYINNGLNADYVKDLAAFVQRQASRKDPFEILEEIHAAALNIASMRDRIQRMLKEQTRQQARK